MELAPSRRDELIEVLARRLEDWGLAAPAVFFLEVNKPMSFVGSQALHFLQPIFGPLVGERGIGELAQLLEERDNLERLVTRLESGTSRL